MTKKNRIAERKKEREQSRQRDQVKYAAIALVVFAIVAALVYFATNLPGEVTIPETVNRTDKFLSDTTSEGYYRLGNPNAPVEVREFASFACSGCLTFHQTVFPQLLPLIEGGQMSFVFVPLTTGSVPNPEGANRTAMCAGEQGKFWEMHEVLFDWQASYGNAAFQDGRLRGAISALGMDSGVFNSCVNSDRINTVLNTALDEGISSTPTITVNGAAVGASYEEIVQAVSSNITTTTFESGLKPASGTEATAESVSPTTAPTTVPTTAPTIAPTTEPTTVPTLEPTATSNAGEVEQTEEPTGDASIESNAEVASQACSDDEMKTLAGFTLVNWDRVSNVNFTYGFEDTELLVSRSMEDYTIILPVEDSVEFNDILTEYVYLEDLREFHFRFQHGGYYYDGDIYEPETMTISQSRGLELLRLFTSAISNCV
jgi:protein-disulfide isomerase